jgi:hypothetical protein
MKRTESCYSCRYWEGQGVRQRGPKGTCRRLPPTVTSRSIEGTFPTTKSTDWCGEWKREAGQSAASTEAADRTPYDELGT